MRLIITAAVAALAVAFAGTAVDAKKAKSHRHSFNVSCPAFPLAPVDRSMGKCSASGKSKEAAREACQAKHNFCYIKDAKHGKKHKKHKKHMAKK
jgi:hypothetical protein